MKIKQWGPCEFTFNGVKFFECNSLLLQYEIKSLLVPAARSGIVFLRYIAYLYCQINGNTYYLDQNNCCFDQKLPFVPENVLPYLSQIFVPEAFENT